ncbi:MAG: bifunctional methylenetetrahydrofolate dehydrogenase/methenyltetrahydrofolate cyclohydrolase [Candidatus Pacebacteria bacterium]|nr:bifunctional methylenetetrahydrofolate dehydrogenase/methenyltetrahydrofolate cyclohydrolase [Candidatus Paceibacterota bacterium]
MILLEGKKISDEKSEGLKNDFSKLDYKSTLLIVRVGEDKASDVYVSKKVEFGEKIGVNIEVAHFESSVTEEEIISRINKGNEDRLVKGIIVQLPLPVNFDKEKIINAIDSDKDVDGLTAKNLWRLMNDGSGIIPATAGAVDLLLKEYSIDVSGKHIVIVGDSILVGKPMAIHFLNRDATVTICHDKTRNLADFTKQADILIVAVGKQNLINSFHMGTDQVVVDIGISRLDDGKVVGDVDFDSVKDMVSAITPVPGGIGPLNVFYLFENLLLISKK